MVETLVIALRGHTARQLFELSVMTNRARPSSERENRPEGKAGRNTQQASLRPSERISIAVVETARRHRPVRDSAGRGCQHIEKAAVRNLRAHLVEIHIVYERIYLVYG